MPVKEVASQINGAGRVLRTVPSADEVTNLSNDLVEALVRIKDVLRALDQVGGVDALSRLSHQELHGHAEFPHIAVLAKELYEHSELLERQLRESATGGHEIVSAVPRALSSFYEREVRPRTHKIWKLSDLCGPFSLADLLGDEEPETDGHGTEIRQSMQLATSRTLENLGDDPSFEEYCFGLADDVAHQGYFCPDTWYANQKSLRPVLARSHEESLAPQLQGRLRDCYRSFLFANYLACVAMCRATLEYAVKEFLLSAGAEIRITAEGRPRDRDLGSLIDIVAVHLSHDPRIPQLMHRVRLCGNVVLHPAAGNNICEFPTDRERAIACIEALRKVLSELRR